MRLKTLFITTEFPYPADGGGKFATLSYLKALAETSTLTVASLTENVAPADVEALRASLPLATILEPVPHQIRIRTNPKALLLTALRMVGRNIPYVAAKFLNKSFAEQLRHLIGIHRYDAIVFNQLGSAAYLPTIKSALSHQPRLLLQEYNVEHQLIADYSARRAQPLRALAWLESRRTRAFEQSICDAMDAVFAISAEDAEALRQLTATQVEFLPLPIAKMAPVSASASQTKGISFLGTLTWPPNREGLEWFIQCVAPIIRGRSTAPIRIGGAGSLDPHFIPDHIEMLGYVEDLTEFYTNSQVFISPILSGSGIRIKILDAMRAGVPVVSTSAGAKGLAIQNERELLIADTPQGFAEAIIRLLEDVGLRERLVQNAHTYIATHHTMEAVQAKFMAACQSPPSEEATPYLGLPISPLSNQQVIATIKQATSKNHPLFVLTANLDFIALAQKNAAFGALIREADVVTADGMPLVWASRLAGTPLPERVTGADLTVKLCELSGSHDFRIFFLGAAPGVAEKAREEALRRFPDAKIVGCYAPGPDEVADPVQSQTIVAHINASQANVLLVAFGAPKQEFWIAQHRHELQSAVCIGVGGSIDFLAGTQIRAPRWMQASGLEWAFRLLHRPRQLFKRYLVQDLPVFGRLLVHAFRHRLSRARTHPHVYTDLPLESHIPQAATENQTGTGLMR